MIPIVTKESQKIAAQALPPTVSPGCLCDQGPEPCVTSVRGTQSSGHHKQRLFTYKGSNLLAYGRDDRKQKINQRFYILLILNFDVLLVKEEVFS